VLIVKGDSMSPEIRDGAYVLFTQNEEYKTGDILVVNNEWGETMCKRFREKEGRAYLSSENPEYPTVEANEHYRIIGKVIESWTRKKH
jgi:phage repressor protein C with HTH and peptisase S24 domain